MEFIKRNICKILIALSLCLTLVLTITFTTKTYALADRGNGYTILPSGIQSKNKFYWKTDLLGTRATSNCTVTNNNDGSLSVSGITGNRPFFYFRIRNTNYNQNTQYTISYTTSNSNLIQFTDLNGNRVQLDTYATSLNNNSGYWDFGIEFKSGLSNASIQIFNIIISEGTTPLNYFPYGNIVGNNEYDWNEDVIEQNENLMKNSTSALYNALNGAYAELVGNNQTVLANGYCTLQEDTRRFTIENLPNSFNQYYDNYDSENPSYNTRPDIKIYLNYTVTNSLLFSFNDTQLDRTITLQNSNNTNSVTASNGGNEDMIDPYTLIINKENIGYDIIYYSGIYIPDYWDINFNISFDAYTYSQGYTKGVESQQTKISIAEGNANYYKRLYEQTNDNYEELLERYNQINNNNSLYGMIVAIADTPINIFKQIFNFDILGINISGVVFGLISLLVIIWLIKKLI